MTDQSPKDDSSRPLYGEASGLDIHERLRRARLTLSRTDASLLRTTAHGWLDIDELTLIGPTQVARQILAALDALAIIYGEEAAAREFDAVMVRVNDLG